MSFEQGPYLITAAFCEQVIEDKSGVLSLIRIVDRKVLSVQGSEPPDEMPPVTLDWTLVVTLKSGDVRGTHPVTIQPILPSGEASQRVTLPVHLQGGNLGQNIISKVNMPLTMPGVYWFKIFVDDEFLTQVPVEVIYSKIVTPGPPAAPSS